MTQFTVYALPKSGLYVVDVQSDLLDGLATRLVIPLVAADVAPRPRITALNPSFAIGDSEYVLMTQAMTSIPQTQLREAVGRLEQQRGHIVRSIDALLSGI